jgi:adenylate cyclase
MPQNRQLAAIMFTDIEGYSSIMQRDEEKAMQLKNRHREILQKEHADNYGRIIQYYGDGTLSIFQSAVNAVQCAMAMQIEFGNEPKVPVRIGLHSGDIIFDEGQIFGDGVNLASRIESLGIAGSVLVSDKVNDEIKNHPEFNTVSVGAYQFKNIHRIVEVFALKHSSLIIPQLHTLSGKTEMKKPSAAQQRKKLHAGNKAAVNPSLKSIAVLPFINMSNDPDQDYFGDGVAEEILTSLSGLKQLKVAGRASSFIFTGKNKNPREIGEKLGVNTILEGSIRKQANRVRVTVQLINVANGYQLWSERYDRDMDDIFAIQDEIALSITEKLKVTLLDHDRKKITKNHTNNTEAYELYLKGRFYVNRRGAAIITAIKYFQLAIDMDPDFAVAYTGFADANFMAASYGIQPPRELIFKAKDAAEKALKLNPELCEPYCSLGFYYTCWEWNWKEAERNFLKSIEINPSYAQAHYWYGLNFLSWAMGDFEKAQKHGLIAIKLEPLSSICYGMYGPMLHAAGKLNEALAVCNSGLELDANAFTCHIYKGWANLFMGKYDDAIAAFEHLMKISGRHHFAQGALIITLCMKGDMDEARKMYEDFKSRTATEYIACAGIGFAAGFLGEIDEAFFYLEKGIEARDPMILTIRYEHWIHPHLRADPRFKKLLKKIGFPE